MAEGTITPQKTFGFKLVLLGDSAVGKSSLVLRFVKGQFHEYQESTIGAAFLTQTISLDDALIKFEIWDTAGQERYHSLAPMYYRGAQAAIVVYDITHKDSFDRAKSWIEELKKYACAGIIIALAGNKNDLEASRAISFEEGQSLADENDLIFMETSAKTSTNVREIFLSIGCFLFVLSLNIIFHHSYHYYHNHQHHHNQHHTTAITTNTTPSQPAKKLPKVAQTPAGTSSIRPEAPNNNVGAAKKNACC